MSPRSERQRADVDPDLRARQEAVASRIRGAVEYAASPLEVYRAGLAAVAPMVGATFASVFLRDEEDADLLRLTCALSWPQSSARFLSELRIREGRGPTGQAVAQDRPIEVVDVFEDAELKEWWEPAREIGFVAMTAHPLVVDGRTVGAISFYFEDRQPLDGHQRAIIGTAARELAAAGDQVRA